MPVVSVGAAMLAEYTDSATAEFSGVELALGALLKLSRGYADIAPHDAQIIIQAKEIGEASVL